MTKLTLEIFDDIVSALNKVREINDSGIELEIPEGSVLFENVLNLKLIQKYADRYNIVVHFTTADPAGLNLIEMVEEGTAKFGLEAKQSISDNLYSPTEVIDKPVELSGGFQSKTHRARITLPKLRFNLLPIGIALLLVLLYHFSQTTRQATAKITINSQPLTRSLTVKIKAGVPTDPKTKVLAGSTVSNTFNVSADTPTTGEKIVGDKATGKAMIYNYTDTEHTFKKGYVLTYSSNSVDYNFTIKEEATVAAEDLTDPANPIPGSVEVDITADTVGDTYNIDKDKTLAVKSYKKSDFAGKTSTKIAGGTSKTIKIVADLDIAKVESLLDQQETQQSSSSLSQKIASSQSLVTGGTKFTVISETPDHKLGDETTALTIVRSVQADGLVYMKSELDRLLDALVKDLVPQGFVLSSKDRQVSVEVLGNSTNSVLSSTEADVQVTLKTFVVPDISVESVKNQLAGKSAGEAQKILGSIQNVKTYEFNLNRGIIPIFGSVPTNLDKINVEIVNQ